MTQDPTLPEPIDAAGLVRLDLAWALSNPPEGDALLMLIARAGASMAKSAKEISTLKAGAEGMAETLETLIERFDMYLPHSNEPHSNVAVRTRRMMEGGRNAVKAYRAATSGAG